VKAYFFKKVCFDDESRFWKVPYHRCCLKKVMLKH